MARACACSATLAAAALASACAGPQSALDPAGRHADVIARLFWLMAGGACLVWAAMVALTVHALRGKEPRARREAAVRPGGCARCHGVSGHGREGPAFPRLAGQQPAYLLGALEAFASGRRHSGIMAPVAASLDPERMRELAAYYGGLDPAAEAPRARDLSAIERGRAIAQSGIPSQRVPPCASCHGPGTSPRNPAYPNLSGQHAEYMALQLDLFRSDRRGGSAFARIMQPVGARLTAEQARDVALYYESLPR